MSVFDSSSSQFAYCIKAGRDYDLEISLMKALVKVMHKAVTVVENHDTQPLQALEAPIEPWFKPLAYALILLRQKVILRVFTPTCMARSTRIKEGMK
jgi:alpha-amylase